MMNKSKPATTPHPAAEEAVTPERDGELQRLRREFDLSGLGDRPPALSAKKLQRLIKLERLEALAQRRSEIAAESNVADAETQQLREALRGTARYTRSDGLCWCPHGADDQSGHLDFCGAARAALQTGGGEVSEQLSEKIARELEPHLDPYFRLNRDWREQVAAIIQRHLSESQQWQELTEAQRLYEQTTQGEWKVGPDANLPYTYCAFVYSQNTAKARVLHKVDAEWIAAAHNLWPKLVAHAGVSRAAVWDEAIRIAYQVYKNLDAQESDFLDFLEGKFTQNLTEGERTALVSFHDQQTGAKYVITALEAARVKETIPNE